MSKNAQTSIIDNIDIKFLCLSDILSIKISVGRENDIIDILKTLRNMADLLIKLKVQGFYSWEEGTIFM